MFKDYYHILGLSQDASSEEIRKAYHTMSLKWHPDKNLGRDVTQIMQDINEAYSILKDESSRKRYDEEYSRFTSYQKQSIYNVKTYYKDSTSWNYYYDVQDEKLKQDITEARKTAKDLVDNFMNSFKRASSDAVKGGWDFAKDYLLYALVAFLAFGVLTIYRSFQNDSRNVVGNTTNEVENASNYPPLHTTEIMLERYNPPAGWKKYRINQAFSISVPNTVELRHEYDPYTRLLIDNGLAINTSDVVFQQKGLANSVIENVDEHYCRIMLRHIEGEYGDFPDCSETQEITDDLKNYLNELVKEQLGPDPNVLIDTPTYEWEDIDGIKALATFYRRVGNNNGTTACAIYLFFNNHEAVKAIVAYREQERQMWFPDLENMIRTFSWEKTDVDSRIPPKYKTFSNRYFTINYLSDWIVSENFDAMTDVAIGSNTESIAFTVVRIPTSESLDSINLEGIRTGNANGLKTISSKRIKINGYQGYINEIDGTLMGVNVKQISYLFKEKGMFYNIKFGNDASWIDNHRDVMSHIINTFEIK